MSSYNRYNPNDKLIRLKSELREAENELEYAPKHRKENVEKRIANIKEAIRQEEEIIEAMGKE